MGGYMIFLIATDLPGIIGGQPESGWGAFFSLLMLPFFGAALGIFLWSLKFYKRLNAELIAAIEGEESQLDRDAQERD